MLAGLLVAGLWLLHTAGAKTVHGSFDSALAWHGRGQHIFTFLFHGGYNMTSVHKGRKDGASHTGAGPAS